MFHYKAKDLLVKRLFLETKYLLVQYCVKDCSGIWALLVGLIMNACLS